MTRSREVSKGATRVEFVYTATAAQTSFSGNDANSNSLAYTVGQIDVFLNGVRLAAADYTATNGTAVVLGAGAEVGDTLNINAFGTFSVADVLVARAEFDYTATANQTTFTGSDNDSQTMAYTAGRIDVYLNGSHLNQTDDYVATNGTSVVLESGASAGDILHVVAHGTVNLASNILSGDLDLAGNELILDADNDTTITADTDDQIDIKIAGADDFAFKANSFEVQTGSIIDMNGTELVLDADGDTSITADTDDQIDFKTGGTDRVHIISDGKVGIGTSSPTDNLTVSTSGDTNFMIKSGSSNNGRIHFADADDTDVGRIIYDHANNNLTFWTNDNERIRIDSDGNVYFGTTSSAPWTATSGTFARIGDTFPLTTTNAGINAIFNRNTSTGTLVEYKQAGNVVGSVSVTASNTAYNTSSDYRLKENVNYSFDATARLKQLKPCRFNWIIDDTNTAVDGFIAHEVSSIVPEAITGTKDATKVQDVFDSDGVKTGTETVPDYQGIDQSKLVPLLVKTIQELEARITALES